MIYLLDSGPLNQLVHDLGAARARVQAAEARGDRVGTVAPIVAEFLGGIEHGRTRDRNLPIANAWLALLAVLPFELDAAREYARLYGQLRRRGVRMQVPDLMLAAVAFTVGDCAVVSADTDLRRVPGLSVEDWTDAPDLGTA